MEAFQWIRTMPPDEATGSPQPNLGFPLESEFYDHEAEDDQHAKHDGKKVEVSIDESADGRPEAVK
jgi:hypothetical protein